MRPPGRPGRVRAWSSHPASDAGVRTSTSSVGRLVHRLVHVLQSLGKTLAQDAELERVEDLVHLFAVPVLADQGVRREVERDVTHQLGQPAVA